MSEETLEDISALEPFKDSLFPIYWIDDPKIIKAVEEDVFSHGLAYGTEVGFGGSPTRVTQIDPNIKSWLLYEPGIWFETGRSGIKDSWEGVDPSQLPEDLRIYALKSNLSPTGVRADILVYRNPTHVWKSGYLDLVRKRTPIVSMSSLRPYQRIMIIINSHHQHEVKYYREDLKYLGFDPKMLAAQPLKYSNNSSTDYPEEYIFDFTKDS